ncbi:MAG: hypothetical protein NTY02_19510 [Acidobacteria bacterium]|nr:hypothetical protein [Acidobacteriota bacterium]
MMATTHWSDRLVTMGACTDAVAWARTQPNLTTAWARCERGDWMLWLAGRRIGKQGSMAHRRVVTAASACARMALPTYEQRYPEDKRPRTAILSAERWARVPSEKNRVAAYAAADAAAYAAAYAAYAAYAAANAANAAANAANAADVQAQARLAQSNQLRILVPNPFR